MPTFIDESGDTGHARDSLPYFRLAAVWMPHNDIANSFREKVRDLRRRMRLDSSFEFKFSKTQVHHDRRQAFFGIAMEHEFKFSFCGINKTTSYWSTASSFEQHWATATSLAVCLKPTYLGAESANNSLRESILVDDNHDKSFLKTVSTAFGGLKSVLHPKSPMTSAARFRGSKPDEVMHLVDMICGAAGAFVDGEKYWHGLVKCRCAGMVLLP
jgi:hypothetical protein